MTMQVCLHPLESPFRIEEIRERMGFDRRESEVLSTSSLEALQACFMHFQACVEAWFCIARARSVALSPAAHTN